MEVFPAEAVFKRPPLATASIEGEFMMYTTQ
jgi:hypothetical protein